MWLSIQTSRLRLLLPQVLANVFVAPQKRFTCLTAGYSSLTLNAKPVMSEVVSSGILSTHSKHTVLNIPLR